MAKLFKKVGIFALAAFGALVALGNNAFAAADADLTAALASSTAFWTDNKGTVVSIFLAFFIPILIIGIIFALLNRGRRMATGAAGGGRRRMR